MLASLGKNQKQTKTHKQHKKYLTTQKGKRG